MKMLNALGVAAAALLVAPAAAQNSAPAAGAASSAAAVTTGATVYDTKGGTVGTVDSVNGGVAVVSTGTNKVGLPLTSFATGPNGPVIAMTKEELDAAAGKAAADAAAALKTQLAAGATVYGSAGAELGTVKEADDQFVTLNRGSGAVKLPMSAFTKGDRGAVLSMTAEQLDAAVSAAAPK